MKIFLIKLVVRKKSFNVRSKRNLGQMATVDLVAQQSMAGLQAPQVPTTECTWQHGSSQAFSPSSLNSSSHVSLPFSAWDIHTIWTICSPDSWSSWSSLCWSPSPPLPQSAPYCHGLVHSTGHVQPTAFSPCSGLYQMLLAVLSSYLQ